MTIIGKEVTGTHINQEREVFAIWHSNLVFVCAYVKYEVDLFCLIVTE